MVILLNGKFLCSCKTVNIINKKLLIKYDSVYVKVGLFCYVHKNMIRALAGYNKNTPLKKFDFNECKKDYFAKAITEEL